MLLITCSCIGLIVAAALLLVYYICYRLQTLATGYQHCCHCSCVSGLPTLALEPQNIRDLFQFQFELLANLYLQE